MSWDWFGDGSTHSLCNDPQVMCIRSQNWYLCAATAYPTSAQAAGRPDHLCKVKLSPHLKPCKRDILE